MYVFWVFYCGSKSIGDFITFWPLSPGKDREPMTDILEKTFLLRAVKKQSPDYTLHQAI